MLYSVIYSFYLISHVLLFCCYATLNILKETIFFHIYGFELIERGFYCFIVNLVRTDQRGNTKYSPVVRYLQNAAAIIWRRDCK